MSTECDRINDELYRAIHGDAWHGPPLKALLADVPVDLAIAHPIPARTVSGARDPLDGVGGYWASTESRARRREPTPEEDWPPVGTVSPAAWAEAVVKLDKAYADLRRVALSVGDGTSRRSGSGQAG